MKTIRATVFIAIAFCFPQKAIATDFTDTYIYYMLTMAQDLRLELDNVNKLYHSMPEELKEKDKKKPSVPGYLFGRIEFPPLDADTEAGQFAMVTLGGEGGFALESGPSFTFWGGFTYWGHTEGDTSEKYKAQVYLVMLGATAKYKEWIDAKFDISYIMMATANDDMESQFHNLDTYFRMGADPLRRQGNVE